MNKKKKKLDIHTMNIKNNDNNNVTIVTDTLQLSVLIYFNII